MRAWLAFGAVTVWLLGAVPAAAQDDTARARQLFTEGLEFADQGQWQQAAERFRATIRIRQSPAVAYNLAVALEQLGQLGEAATLLQTVVEDPDADRRMKQQARTLLRSVSRRVGRLTIELQSDLAGARVRIDSREVPPEQLGRPVPVDPGTRTVTLVRGTRVVERREVTVSEGGSESITLGRGDSGVAPTTDPDRGTGDGDGDGGDGDGDGAADGERDLDGNPLDDEMPGDRDPVDDDGGGGGSILTRWWFWTVLAAVVVVGVGGAILVSSGGDPDPVQGNLTPGIIEVELP